MRTGPGEPKIKLMPGCPAGTTVQGKLRPAEFATAGQVEILDDALQTFFVIGLVATRALADLPHARDAQPQAAALTEILDLASTATARLRRVLIAIDHPSNEKLGFVHALRRLVLAYCARWARRRSR